MYDRMRGGCKRVKLTGYFQVVTSVVRKRDPAREARELREKLLRDKIKRMRGSVSSGQSGKKVDASQQNESPPAPDFTE